MAMATLHMATWQWQCGNVNGNVAMALKLAMVTCFHVAIDIAMLPLTLHSGNISKWQHSTMATLPWQHSNDFMAMATWQWQHGTWQHGTW